MVCWALDLLLDLAPFSFPGPVLGTIVFFALILLLDWLSEKYPGKTPSDADKDIEKMAGEKQRRPKRFVDPVMAVLGPPCDFLLRNMSCLFTPAFIMIPARESIPGKEIGILAGWFAITQVLGYVIPVLIVRALEWMYGTPKRVKALRERREKRRLLKKHPERSQRGSVATLPGIDFEKRVPYGGGERLGSIATGLSGVTAVVVAPVSHLNMDYDMSDDMRRHISGVALEQARQQGIPMPQYADASHNNIASDVSNFQHNLPHHHRLHHLDHGIGRPGAPRSKSVPGRATRPGSSSRRDASAGRGSRPGTADRPGSAGSRNLTVDRFGGSIRGRRGLHPDADILPGSPLARWTESKMEPVRPRLNHGVTAPATAGVLGPVESGSFDPNFSFDRTAARTVDSPQADLSPTDIAAPPRVFFDENLQTAAERRRQLDGPDAIQVERSGSDPSALDMDLNTAVNSRRQSGDETRKNSTATAVTKEDEIKKQTTDAEDEDEDEDEDDADDGASMSSAESYGPDAIERLASWICDLMTPTIYGILFVVGLPIFFTLNFALPLHMAINILTFWIAITVVPAKLRRYAHPILTTSLLTVLIIWAFGAMRGLSLKEELSYYERRAKFNVLWTPSGYNGPAPGAGDILASLLDAGIVALFVPLYRYRKDLKACGLRLTMALFPCACLSLFFWPLVASLMGLDQIRALAFAARFLSTPLAIQLVNTLGGDESITVILVVLTGIIAAIFKEPFFKLMRVDMDDHLTIGVTFGATSGAIGASSLIARPRVMALASLGFVIFGVMCLIGAAIPPLVDIIRSIASVRA